MTQAVDLFGAPVTIDTSPRAKRKEPTPRGHAQPIGSGPAGETCGSCEHLTRRRTAAGYAHLKCRLAKLKWTCGRGSDVRARDAACRSWEKEKTDEPQT